MAGIIKTNQSLLALAADCDTLSAIAKAAAAPTAKFTVPDDLATVGQALQVQLSALSQVGATTIPEDAKTILGQLINDQINNVAADSATENN